MRIIAGVAKGRRLHSPGAATRPMMDRAREALFSSLGARVVGAAVLDLYAGSGSLGLEALSRGASRAVFVERQRGALRALDRNIVAVGLGGEVVASDVEDYLHRAEDRFDLVFVDPPYALSLASSEQVLGLVVPRLSGGGLVVVHRRAGSGVPEVAGLIAGGHRRYGDTEITRLEKEDDG
jgi:16S rRNA (guanine966-N2)-methyltransferase